MVIEIKNKLRILYSILFIVILSAEILIALFVRDNFVRPYLGDVLVTVLICCFLRIAVPQKIKVLPIFVLVFSVLVEIGQYFDFVKLLGLDDNIFLSTLLGRTFSFADIICYVVGCAVFAVFDYIVKRKLVIK